MGDGFIFALIEMINHVVVIDFERDENYQSMIRSLISYMMCSPSHPEIVWWLKETSRFRTHGLPFLFVDRDKDLRRITKL